MLMAGMPERVLAKGKPHAVAEAVIDAVRARGGVLATEGKRVAVFQEYLLIRVDELAVEERARGADGDHVRAGSAAHGEHVRAKRAVEKVSVQGR